MKHTIDYLGVSAFCESMAMMLQAGIQTDEAIDLLLEDQSSDSAMMTALNTIRDRMEEGLPFSEALSESNAFPEYAVSMIKVAESSGRLEDVFLRLSSYYAEQNTIAKSLRSAVTYPASMLVLILAVLIVMLAKVLPVFTDVYSTMTGSISGSSYHYISWAYGFCWIAFAIMLIITIILLGGLLMWKKDSARAKVSRVLEKLPATRGIMESMALGRFVSSASIMLAGGCMQDEAVADSIPMTQCESVEKRLNTCMDRMNEGESFAQASYSVGLFEPVYGRMLLAGSRTGNLDNVMSRLSDLLREDMLARVESLVGIVDPVLSGIMMVTVGFTLISVMLPLIGMMSSIG